MPRVYWMETKTEFLKLARMRTYCMSTIGFPTMFYCFFGLAMGQYSPKGTMPMAQYLLATYGAFGVIGATLFALGVGVAVERGLGWFELKRASPMPPPAYIFAKAAVGVAFGAIVVAVLFGLGATFGGVRMPAGQWLLLGTTLVLGAIPFCALGLVLGLFAGPNSAPGTVNMIYLPMAFMGGLWIPFQFLPSALKQIAPFLPTYHFAQIALAVLHAPVEGTVGGHIEALAGFTALFMGIAWIAQSRDRAKMYG